MKTYKSKIIAWVCILLVSMSGCDSLCDTDAECNMLLMGTMSYWRSNGFERHINFIAECTTDAAVNASMTNIVRSDMEALSWKDDNESIYRPWQQFYACINAANIMIEKVPSAYAAVNELRTRAGLSGLSGLTKEEFRVAIRQEWTFETTHEHIYRFNLIRWGTYLSTMKTYFETYYPANVGNVTADKLYFPSPSRDSLINPNL